MLKYDISPNLEHEAKGGEDSKRENLSMEELEALNLLYKLPQNRLKKTFQIRKDHL